MTFALIVCASLSVIDGDNVRCEGVNMRLLGDGLPDVNGIDAPEYRGRADCEAERAAGEAAAARLGAHLGSEGLEVWDSGVRDRFDRPLVSLRLPDGSSVGNRLIEEGHAVEWTPGYQSNWCG